MITVPSGSSYSYFSSWFLKPTCFAHFAGLQLLLYVTNIKKKLKIEVFCLLYSLYCKGYIYIYITEDSDHITPKPLDTKASDKQLHKSGCVRKDETIAASQRAKAGSASFCWLFLSQCHLLKLCCTVTASRNAHTQLKMADSTELALYTQRFMALPTHSKCGWKLSAAFLYSRCLKSLVFGGERSF